MDANQVAGSITFGHQFNYRGSHEPLQARKDALVIHRLISGDPAQV
jgi:hypothetical protein